MRELERTTSERVGKPLALPPIAVIGRGRVGGSVIRAATTAGLTVAGAGRDDLALACEQSEVALLCVPDAEIEAACEAVCRFVPTIRMVGHTSGATTLEALRSAREAGAETFSLHPLQTVPDAATPLAGSPAAIAGSSPDAEALARGLAEALGMTAFLVPEESRAAYHAAASIASNFLVTLEASASALLEQAGIAGGRELLTPLVLRTASNWAERGEAALTGPIARGDEETVARHLAALDETAPELRELYEALASRTRAVATHSEGAAR